MKSLASQALETVGKWWMGGSKTRNAKLQAIKRFANYVWKTFGLQDIRKLKPGHIESYAKSLHSKVSPRTGANYMAYVRDLCQAIGKPGICAKDNAAYGFGCVARQNPQVLNTVKVTEIMATLNEQAEADVRCAMMMVAAAGMRKHFGLRHKEALMSSEVVVMEDGKEFLIVKGAKGGRQRKVEVKTQGQRDALAKVRETAAKLKNLNGRIMPPELTLEQAMAKESRDWHKMGGTRAEKASMHIARHDYVQSEVVAGVPKKQINQDIGHGDGRSLGSYSNR